MIPVHGPQTPCQMQYLQYYFRGANSTKQFTYTGIYNFRCVFTETVCLSFGVRPLRSIAVD